MRSRRSQREWHERTFVTVAAEQLILTKAQVRTLEKTYGAEAAGEVETAHPGYLGSQDTFYVGTLKGVAGSINRPSSKPTRNSRRRSCTRPRHRSGLRTYSTTGCCGCSSSTRCRCCEWLTDHGTEYCGRAERHDHQLYLALDDIDHTKTMARKLQTTESANGSTRQFCRSYIRLPSARNSTRA